MFIPALLSLSALIIGLAAPHQRLYVLIAWAIIGLVLWKGHRSIGNRWVFVGLLIILGSTFAAIPVSIINKSGFTDLNNIFFVWMIPMFALYLTDHSKFMVPWLVPIFILNLIVMWAQILVLQEHFLMGITGGPNTTAALLVMGAIFCLSRKEWRWLFLAGPLVLSIPFTGSRSAMLVMAMFLPLLAIKAKIPAKAWALFLLVGLVFLAIAIGNQFGQPGESAWLDNIGSKLSPSYTQAHWLSDIQIRLFGLTPYWPSFEPVGFLPEVSPHNIPLRLSVTTGIASAVAWIGITFYGLWRKPRFDTSWWLLLGILALSMLDWYFWQLCLMSFWWILVSIRTKRSDSPDTQPLSRSHTLSSTREREQSKATGPAVPAR